VPEETKEYVFEKCFNERWDESSGTVRNPVVTVREVAEATAQWLTSHPNVDPQKVGNRYAFFKDFIRNLERANKRWPKSIFERKYTARQLTGGGASFEFIPLRPRQVVPFPNAVPPPDPSTPTHRIESISMPLASRLLGREDEPWLIQVLVRLHVIETHLSLYSTRNILQIDHLQMSVKLYLSEIDALFLAVEDSGPGGTQEVIVTCEAKGLRDDILESQVLLQAESVFQTPNMNQDTVIPIAVKAHRESVVHVVEFEAIARDIPTNDRVLTIASQALYQFIPPVPGIGEKKKRKPRLKKTVCFSTD
jgi:hypothetical protein